MKTLSGPSWKRGTVGETVGTGRTRVYVGDAVESGDRPRFEPRPGHWPPEQLPDAHMKLRAKIAALMDEEARREAKC